MFVKLHKYHYIMCELEVMMKNLVSRNELASWKWDEKITVDDKYDQVSEYFQCISECGIIDSSARRFCRHVLTEN